MARESNPSDEKEENRSIVPLPAADALNLKNFVLEIRLAESELERRRMELRLFQQVLTRRLGLEGKWEIRLEEGVAIPIATDPGRIPPDEREQP